ncbi:MAG: chemotaxis protein CheW [Betaproteobacteria bacterium]|nr:chemotaxis protein CheW [Betaproteobacteria bacterium]
MNDPTQRDESVKIPSEAAPAQAPASWPAVRAAAPAVRAQPGGPGGQALPPMGFGPALAGSWMLFEVDGQACAVDSRQLRQVALATSLAELPGRRHRVWPGVIAWQQRVLPVLDCGAAMGRRPSLGREGARVLLVQDDARLWALLVDQVRGVHQEQPERLIEVQPGLPAPWNAVRALLPLPAESGGEVCPVLHVPTLCKGCLEAPGGARSADAEPPEFRA